MPASTFPAQSLLSTMVLWDDAITIPETKILITYKNATNHTRSHDKLID